MPQAEGKGYVSRLRPPWSLNRDAESLAHKSFVEQRTGGGRLGTQSKHVNAAAGRATGLEQNGDVEAVEMNKFSLETISIQ